MPAFRRSANALRVVDSDSFRSFEIVGMEGQQVYSLLARSARYLYTEIALWGRSIRYSSVKFRIVYSSVLGGALSPTLYSIVVFMEMLVGIGLEGTSCCSGTVTDFAVWIKG